METVLEKCTNVEHRMGVNLEEVINDNEINWKKKSEKMNK